MKPPKQIPRVEHISEADFVEEYVRKGRPLVITGLASNWEAVNKWNVNFLKQEAGGIDITCIDVKDHICDVNLEKGAIIKTMKLADASDQFTSNEKRNGIAIATTDDHFSDLLKSHYHIPSLCRNGKYLRTRFFISGVGTTTWMHQDLFENLYTIVDGSKRIILFEPDESVYPHSRFSKLPNHAKTNPDSIDVERFPKMKEAQPYIVELKKGETLFIPSFWWHYLKNTNDTIAISYWWAHGWRLPLVWAAIVYKNLRNV